MAKGSSKPNRVLPLRRWLKRRWAVLGTIAVLIALGALSLVGHNQLSTPVAADTREAMRQAGVLKGDPEAPVTIYEFADYQCPACRRFYQTLAELEADYIKSGKLNHVFIDFPLTAPHPNARRAAIAARCAGRQGAYWRMHDALFQRQPRWSQSSEPEREFSDYVETVGLDGEVFAQCLDSDTAAEAVDNARATGQRLGVAATPTVIVGDRVLDEAPRSSSKLRQIIEAQLRNR